MRTNVHIAARLAIYLFLALGSPLRSQPEWALRLPSSNGSVSIASRGDTGHLVHVGYSHDHCVVKITSAGKLDTAACFDHDIPYRLAAARNGGYFLFGQRFKLQRKGDSAWIGKFRDDGTPVWGRLISDREPMLPLAADVTPDGGLIVGGAFGERPGAGFETAKASFVMKFRSDGTIEWTHTFDVSNYEAILAARSTTDGYVVSGASEAGGWLAGLDRGGAPRWYHWLSKISAVATLDTLPDGDVMAATLTSSGYLILRMTSTGKVKWEKLGYTENAGSVRTVATNTGGGAVLLATETANGSNAARLIAFDSSGTVLWQRLVRFAAGVTPVAMQTASDRGVVVSVEGKAFAEFYKFSASGQPPACIALNTGVTDDIKFSDYRVPESLPPVHDEAVETTASDDPVSSHQRAVAVDSCQTALPSSVDIGVPGNPAERAAQAILERQAKAAFELTQQVVALLSGRKFSDLDRLGNELRETKAQFESGYPKLLVFYNAVSTHAVQYGTPQQHLKLVEEWMVASPNSPTAAVAAAHCYLDYAYDARGSGFSNTVTGEAWKRFDVMRDRAAAIVKSSPYAATDPQYHVERISIAGSQCENVREIAYEQQLRGFAYPSLWRTAGTFLLPRWCGNADEYRRFAEYAASSTRDALGDGMYALLAWDALLAEDRNRQVFGSYKFEWSRMRQGMRDLLTRYPDNLINYERLAYLARFYDDRAAAAAVFDQRQTAWTSDAAQVWLSRAEYNAAREWATTTPVEPFMAGTERGSAASITADPSKTSGAQQLRTAPSSTSWVAGAVSAWPPLVMLDEVRLGDGSRLSFNSFLVQTSKGIVAISAVTKFGKQIMRASPMTKEQMPYVEPPSLDTIRTRIAAWTMGLPSEPKKKLTVALIEPVKQLVPSYGVVLTLAPSTEPLPVRPLTPQAASEAFKTSGRVYIVGCRRPGQASCEQTAFPATIRGGLSGSGLRTLDVYPDDVLDWTDLVGSPVIDENGFAVGVVTTPSSTYDVQYKDKPHFDIEEIGSVLSKAGLER